jgi:hypothetical protein
MRNIIFHTIFGNNLTHDAARPPLLLHSCTHVCHKKNPFWHQSLNITMHNDTPCMLINTVCITNGIALQDERHIFFGANGIANTAIAAAAAAITSCRCRFL